MQLLALATGSLLDTAGPGQAAAQLCAGGLALEAAGLAEARKAGDTLKVFQIGETCDKTCDNPLMYIENGEVVF